MEKAEKERKQKLSFRFVPTRPVIENSKNIAIEFKKLKKIPLRLHFTPKYVGKDLERVKIKIIVPFRSNPSHNRKFKKNSNEIQKIKKYHDGFISSQNRLDKADKERK